MKKRTKRPKIKSAISDRAYSQMRAQGGRGKKRPNSKNIKLVKR